MTKHFKALEDVEIDGTLRAAGSFFSRGDLESEEVDAAIADGKIVNVAAEDVPTPETITESEAAEAEAGAITRDEAAAQGIDVEKVEAEAETVDVVPDPKDDDASSESSDEASTTAEESLG